PLTVTKSGAGSAAVATSPAKIDCGSSCSANFPVRSKVQVTVTPAGDSYLVGWHHPGCSDVQATCEITMDGSVALDIELARKPVISVTIVGGGRLVSTPAGVDCRTKCDVPLNPGSVTLDAEPAPGAYFAGFQGLCEDVGSTPHCVYQLAGDVQ